MKRLLAILLLTLTGCSDEEQPPREGQPGGVGGQYGGAANGQ